MLWFKAINSTDLSNQIGVNFRPLDWQDRARYTQNSYVLICLYLRWLETLSSTFQDFDGSL